MRNRLFEETQDNNS